MKLGSILKYSFSLAFLAYGRYPIAYLISTKNKRKKPARSGLVQHLVRCPSGNTFAISFDGATSGENLVLIHGLNASSDQWHYQRRALQNAYRLILIDLPGHGPTPPYQTMSIAALTDDLHFLLSTFQLQKSFIYGHSIGAMIAMQYAIKYGNEPTKGLILQQGAFTDPLKSCAFPAFMRTIERPLLVPLLQLVKRHPHFFRCLAWLNYFSGLSSIFYRYLLFSGKQNAEELRFMCKLAANSSVAAMAAGILATLKFDVGSSLHEIEIPTLVIGGRFDRIIDVPTSAFIADRVQNGRLRLVQSGHLSIIEDPHAVNRHLISFLTDLA
jgi:pimeloyl-ACP methyl ester carboxylesterase